MVWESDGKLIPETFNYQFSLEHYLGIMFLTAGSIVINLYLNQLNLIQVLRLTQDHCHII